MNSARIAPAAALLALLLSAPAARAADVEQGLYLRTNYAFGNLALSTIYVAPGNKIVVNPRNGVDPFDFDAAAKASPDQAGTYKVEGDKMAVTWASGKRVAYKVELMDGKLSAYDGGLVVKADAYPKDAKLAATFSGGGQTKNVSSAMTLTLAGDGKFTLTRLGGVSRIPGNSGVAEKTTEGTYALSGNTLVLKSLGGEVTKHTVLPFNTALDPKKAKLGDEHMIFDGANLKRVK